MILFGISLIIIIFIPKLFILNRVLLITEYLFIFLSFSFLYIYVIYLKNIKKINKYIKILINFFNNIDVIKGIFTFIIGLIIVIVPKGDKSSVFIGNLFGGSIMLVALSSIFGEKK